MISRDNDNDRDQWLASLHESFLLEDIEAEFKGAILRIQEPTAFVKVPFMDFSKPPLNTPKFRRMLADAIVTRMQKASKLPLDKVQVLDLSFCNLQGVTLPEKMQMIKLVLFDTTFESWLCAGFQFISCFLSPASLDTLNNVGSLLDTKCQLLDSPLGEAVQPSMDVDGPQQAERDYKRKHQVRYFSYERHPIPTPSRG